MTVLFLPERVENMSFFSRLFHRAQPDNSSAGTATSQTPTQKPNVPVSCPSCKKKLRVSSTAIGKKVKCPSCGALFAVPTQPAAQSVPKTSMEPARSPAVPTTPIVGPALKDYLTLDSSQRGPSSETIDLVKVATLQVPKSGDMIFSDYEQSLIVLGGDGNTSSWQIGSWQRIDRSLLPNAKELADAKAHPAEWDARVSISPTGKRWMLSLTKNGAFQFLTAGELTVFWDAETNQVLSTFQYVGQCMGLFRHYPLLGPNDQHIGIIRCSMVGSQITPRSQLHVGKRRQPGSLIDLERADCIRRFGQSVKEAVFSPDEAYLAVLLRKIKNGQVVSEGVSILSTADWKDAWSAERKALDGLRFVPDGGLLGWRWMKDSKQVEVADVATGDVVHRLCPDDDLTQMTYNGHTILAAPDGKLLTGRTSNRVFLWDLRTGQELARLELPLPEGVAYTGLSADHKYLAAASDDSTVNVYELRWTPSTAPKDSTPREELATNPLTTGDSRSEPHPDESSVVKQPSTATTPATAQAVFDKRPDLNDPSITKPIEALASQVRLSSPGTYEFLRNASTAALAEDIGALHRQYTRSAELHYAYAAALQLNLQGETADKVLAECAKAHPTFWIADLTMRRNSLFTWNPLTCPKFDPVEGSAVHGSINSILSKALLLTTRKGVIPRAVVFQRDDGFEVSALHSCRIDFLTTISPVSDPQVVAINACIWDNPSDPYRTEVLACPFAEWHNAQRFSYELLVRQKDFDFVIVDRDGRVKYSRVITPSDRMKAAHSKLVQMFDESEGREISESTHVQAVRKHTSQTNPNAIVY